MKFLRLLNLFNKISDSLPSESSAVVSSDGKKLYKRLNQVTFAVRGISSSPRKGTSVTRAACNDG